MELACAEINQRPGQKLKLKLVFEDNKSTPSGAKDAMKTLVNQKGVLAVIGAVASNNTIAASDVAMEEKVPLLTHASTNVTITQKGQYVSRLCFNDDFQGMVDGRLRAQHLKANTAVLMVCKGSVYSEGLSGLIQKRSSRKRAETISDELAYPERDGGLKTHVTTLKQRNPDVVFLPGYFNEVGLVIRQAREAGFQKIFSAATAGTTRSCSNWPAAT